ncbi:three-helix bundle dimerization domain-containing protein [Kribbella sp. NPDC004536]|uniref:three-helix bundle dimerization domain-containing protein n=1 Tax=Kribbella sp. NPDC004536 TaxID=3364106 RepID=UPI00368EAC8B
MKLDTVREEKAIENLTSRLTDAFADIHTPEDIETAIRTARESFAGDPVRDYVPILIERIVRAELAPKPEPAEQATTAERQARWTRPAVTLEPGDDATAAPDGSAADQASAGAGGGGTAGTGLGEFRRRFPIALPAAVAGVLVLATIATVLVVRNGGDAAAKSPANSGLTTVGGVIGSEKRAFFEDPDVKAVLAKHGFAVNVDTAGSREIATSVDLSKYDFAFPSSSTAAERILQPTSGRPAVGGKKFAVFSSPMAIATYQPIVDLLSATGIARQVNGVWYFNVRKYVDLAKANWRWTNIHGNTTYPVNKRILITTTDPRTSNSAAMFLSIVSYVANHNTVVQSEADEQKVLPLVAPLFVNQGYTDNSSEGPFDDYLSLGMGKSPMVNIYEAQFVEAAVERKLKPGMVLMYPSPTVQSKHTLVSFDANGEKLGQLLATDPELQRLAARHGFRTADESQFASVVKQHDVPVAQEVIDVADTPTYDTLERLLDAVSKSYR